MNKIKRPDWCPHKDCKFMSARQSAMCIGELPKPEPHDDDFNTHRLCMDTRETGNEIIDLQINYTDAYLMKTLLHIIKKRY